MSIINEALKKASRDRMAAGPSPEKRLSSGPRTRSRAPWLIGLAAGGVAATLISFWIAGQRTETAVPPGERPAGEVSPPVAPTPAPVTTPESALPAPTPPADRPAEPKKPADPDRLNTLAVEAFRRGEIQEARRLLAEAALLSPEHAEIRNNLGMVARAEGRPEEAEKEYRRALATRPGYPEAQNNLGVLLQEQGKSAEAREYFQRAVDAVRDYSPAHLNLAVSYDKDGMKAEAFFHYRRFLDTAGPGQADLTEKVKARLGS